MKIKPLLLAFSGFYFVYDPLKELLLDSGNFSKAFYWMTSWWNLVLFVSNVLPFFSFSLGAYWLFHKMYLRERKHLTYLFLPLVALGGIFFRYFLQEYLSRLLTGHGNYNEGTTMTYYISDNLYYAIVFMGIGIVTFFVEYSKYKELQNRALLLQNQKTELAFLRSQLNPHFLFNILNNIYTLIYYKSDNALKSVEKLSALLRYALYEQAEFVSLKKEIQQLDNFIDLHRMRFDYDLALDIKIENGLELTKIAPFILISFVENLFKHGNLKSPTKNALIELKKEGTALIFKVENEKNQQEKDEVGGIGVENVKKRLDLIYGERAGLDISETTNTFNIKVSIDLF